MLNLKEMTCIEGITAMANAMGRLTVLRDILQDAPMQQLEILCHQLAEGEVMQAAYTYHGLTAALLAQSSRRVSGDAWKDYLLSVLLERPNAFSKKAALGEWDEPLAVAMRYDLTYLGTLSQLNSATLKRWLGERFREIKTKPKQARDTIALMSSAVWSGNMPRMTATTDNTPHSNLQLPPTLDETQWVSWRYGNGELQDTYVSDEALEEMYHRLLSAQDWGLHLDDIWNFHHSYGTGMFIRHRLFTVSEHGITGMDPELLPGESEAALYEEQQQTLIYNAIRFMRGERAQNVLITGDAGMGKTTQALTIARELPEVRLLVCDLLTIPSCIEALPVILAQPLKFVLLVDDLDVSHPAWLRLKSALAYSSLVRKNILVIGVAKEGRDSLLPLHVDLPAPALKDFIDFVQLLAVEENMDAELEDIQNRCIDLKAAGEVLSFHMAYRIIEELRDRNPFT